MKALGITSTALLALLLAVAAPAWSQEHEQEQKDKPAQQEEKKVQPQKSAKQEQKPAAQQARRTLSPQRKTHSNTRCMLSPSRYSKPAAVAFPTTALRPILDGSTRFVSAKATMVIAASNMAAIRSDSLAGGQATGSTRKTSMWSRLTASIICATQCIPA